MWRTKSVRWSHLIRCSVCVSRCIQAYGIGRKWPYRADLPGTAISGSILDVRLYRTCRDGLDSGLEPCITKDLQLAGHCGHFTYRALLRRKLWVTRDTYASHRYARDTSSIRISRGMIEPALYRFRKTVDVFFNSTAREPRYGRY